MSDDQDAGDAAESDEQEQPELDEDEIADIPAGAAEEIEAATGPDESDDQDDDAGDDQEGSDELDSLDSSRTSPGDIYCNGLGMLAAVGRANYGTAETDDRSKLVDEYAEVARDLEIDRFVDEWLEEHGGIDQLSPGQAILASTMLWAGMVAMDDPQMLEGMSA